MGIWSAAPGIKHCSCVNVAILKLLKPRGSNQAGGSLDLALFIKADQPPYVKVSDPAVS